VNFISNKTSRSVSGTVFAKEEIRIVDFNGYKLDFEPSANVIAIQNDDRPGIIGKIGTVLGEAQINITAMQWGSRKNKAIAFVSINKKPSEEIANSLKNIDGILRVSLIEF